MRPSKLDFITIFRQRFCHRAVREITIKQRSGSKQRLRFINRQKKKIENRVGHHRHQHSAGVLESREENN